MSKINKLTAAEELALERYMAAHFAFGRSTDPANRPKAEAAIARMYDWLGRPRPYMLWVDGPMDGFAAQVLLLPLILLDDKVDDWLAGRLDLRDQLWDQLGDQLGGQLWGQLWGQLRDQLGGQLRGQLGGQLWDQLRDQLGGQLRGQLGGQLWDQLRDQLMWPYYAQLNAYMAFYDFPAKHIAKFKMPLELAEKCGAWIDLQESCGMFWPFGRFCILSERMSVCEVDRDGRLHCETGPAMGYRDGFQFNAWHGIRVPDDFFDWDLERALGEDNSEVRRCAIERIGWENLTDQLDLVAESPDPGNPGQSLRLFDGDLIRGLYEQPARLLVAANGSVDKGGHRRHFGLPVPASVSDPVEGAALLFDVPADVYRQLARRT